MNKLIKLIVVVLIFGGMSCTKDADIPLPEYKPTLVIHSYISPLDSGVTVYVNMSKAAYNSNYSSMNNVMDATVKISDGITTKTLTFYPPPSATDFSYYFVDSTTFKIVTGKTYTLSVTTPDGKAASASTTIPSVVPINTLDYSLVKSQFGDSVYKMKFTFTDPAGQDDYYSFGTYILIKDTVLNEIVVNSNNEDFGIYFNSDGNLITENKDAYGPSSVFSPEQIRLIDFRLMHVTREYYLYHLSIQNSGGGPFSEPNVAFTNISGGVGVFAGYNYDKRILR